MPFPSLLLRDREAELMDDPSLDGAEHERALRGLGRINLLSASSGTLWRAIEPLALAAPLGQPLRVLDVATGGGDVPVSLLDRARRRGVGIRVDACDVSERALEFARRRAEQRDAPIRFFPLDALTQPIAVDTYDVVTASLFLHHLDDSDSRRLLTSMRDAARQLVLVSDLRRSRRGYLAAALGTRLLSRSRVVHVDGPRSVRAAYTLDEAQRLADRAGLAAATVQRVFPFRWLLQWRRPDAA